MSRMLYQLSYPAKGEFRAPNRNRTDDLFLTMETLYRLSYGGQSRSIVAERAGGKATGRSPTYEIQALGPLGAAARSSPDRGLLGLVGYLSEHTTLAQAPSWRTSLAGLLCCSGRHCSSIFTSGINVAQNPAVYLRSGGRAHAGAL